MSLSRLLPNVVGNTLLFLFTFVFHLGSDVKKRKKAHACTLLQSKTLCVFAHVFVISCLLFLARIWLLTPHMRFCLLQCRRREFFDKFSTECARQGVFYLPH